MQKLSVSETESRYIVRRSTVSRATVLGLGALVAASAHSQAALVTPKSANAFVNSVGVNTHVTAGGIYSDKAQMEAALVDLGIKHIRDGVNVNNPAASDYLKTLYTNRGIRTALTVDWSRSPISSWGSQDPLIGTLNIARDRLGNGTVEALLGPNEPNLKGYSTWSSDTNYWIKRLRTIVRTDPNYSAFSSTPLIGPAIAGGNGEPDRDIPVLKATFSNAGDNIENYVNYGGFHPYPNGGQPPDVKDTIETEINRQRGLYPTRQFWATETGYHNATSGNGSTTERAAGIYAPRLYLEYFGNRNIARTYWYELFNEDFGSAGISNTNNEENYGLYRFNRSRKPAGTAIKNMLAQLNDTGTPTLTPLDYTITAPTGVTVRSVLLRKSSGSYYLCVWLPAYVTQWWVTPPVDTNPVDQPCTLRLAASKSVSIYANLDSTMTNTSLGTGTTFNFTASERVILIRIA